MLRLSPSDFVLVRFCTKKNIKHYIGQVQREDDDGDLEVKFLRKSTNGAFIFPLVDDISSVLLSDIVKVLNTSKVHRGAFSFQNDLSNITNLN